MELEEDYGRQRGSGSGGEFCYSVEARVNYHAPRQIGKQIFDNRWRPVNFDRGAIGVPAASPIHRQTLEHGYLGYSAAEALRWWLHAVADAENNGLCLETRIIKHEINYRWEIEALSMHHIIGSDDRSSIMPDWGEKRS